MTKLSEKVTYHYDHYYKYNEIITILNEYEKNYPHYCKVEMIATTLEGRGIPAISITDLSTGDYASKPAFYIQGNIHAGEVTGSMVCMYFLDTMISNLEEVEIQKILKKYTIYCIPRLSPDGSEYYLTTPNSIRSINTYYPYSSQKDGLVAEDIDGDGVIRKMRVKDVNGIWKVSNKDPRVMVRRRPDDDEGEFYQVYSEGMIQGYNGKSIQEAPNRFANDYNRNFPINWMPEEIQRGAGIYPLANVETKAIADFLITHNNICIVMDMHTSGGQILYTPGSKARKDVPKQDVELIKAIGQMGKEENGFPLINVHDEYCDPASDVCWGLFIDYTHFLIGVPSYAIECWDLGRRAGVSESYPPKPKTDQEQEESMYQYLKWIDENLNGEGYLPWTKFNHPQLGEVEIGGFDYKYICQNPPIPYLVQELQKHTNFFLRQLKTLPVVDFTDIKVENIADNIYKINVSLINKGFLPTYALKEGLKNRKLTPLQLEIDDVQLIHGKKIEEIGQLAGYGCTMGYNGPWGPSSKEVEPTKKEVEWIFSTDKDSIHITASGSRMGKKEITIQLK